MVLSPSASVAYGYDAHAAAALTGRSCAHAADPLRDLVVADEPVHDDGRYRITVTDDVADGRDRFEPFRRGPGRRSGPTDLQALEAALATGTLGAPAQPRVRRTG